MQLSLEVLQAIARKNRWWLAEPGRSTIAWPGGHVIGTTASFISANMGSNIFALPNSRVTADYGSFVCATHESSIFAKTGSIVIAHPGSSIWAVAGAIIWAFPGAFVTNHGARLIVVNDDADIQLHAGASNPSAATEAHRFFCAVAREIRTALNVE